MQAYIKERTPKKTNKTTEVLNYLKENGSITSMDAFYKFGATRLSAIIFTLRRRGYDIQNKDRCTLDRYGNKCNFVEYVLMEEKHD